MFCIYDSHMKASENQKKLMREWYQRNKDRLKESKKAHYQSNKEQWKKQPPEVLQERARAYNRRIREEVIEHYGGKCVCCGENRYEFMAIDHINGGGVQHRKSIGWSGNSIAKWLRKNDYPDGFRILCHNCNLAKGFYKVCPHERG